MSSSTFQRRKLSKDSPKGNRKVFLFVSLKTKSASFLILKICVFLQNSKPHRKKKLTRSFISTIWFTLSISTIQILFFTSNYLQSDDGPLIYHPCKRAQIWRLFTCILVHDDIQHLSSNLLVQISIGYLLEPTLGWQRMTLIYLTGTLFSSLISPIFSPEAVGIGAGGAVTALLGVLAAQMLEFKYSLIRIIALVILLSEFCFDVFHHYFFAYFQSVFDRTCMDNLVDKPTLRFCNVLKIVLEKLSSNDNVSSVSGVAGHFIPNVSSPIIST